MAWVRGLRSCPSVQHINCGPRLTGTRPGRHPGRHQTRRGTRAAPPAVGRGESVRRGTGAGSPAVRPLLPAAASGRRPVRYPAAQPSPGCRRRTVGSLLSVTRWQAGDWPSWSAGGAEGSLEGSSKGLGPAGEGCGVGAWILVRGREPGQSPGVGWWLRDQLWSSVTRCGQVSLQPPKWRWASISA